VNIQLSRLQKRLDDMNVTLTLSDAAKALIAEKGFDPIYGARPLKRTIQQYIENPLSMEILKGDVRDGSTITVDAEGENVVFEVIPPRTTCEN
ncbi:MAG: type VI secretion system ATPase TssH, partial [Desulfosalsimonadaceae bacterium]|nr:type VI secretion system ATPase TssH [Desulfosalsimonadaceae bacterium]